MLHLPHDSLQFHLRRVVCALGFSLCTASQPAPCTAQARSFNDSFKAPQATATSVSTTIFANTGGGVVRRTTTQGSGEGNDTVDESSAGDLLPALRCAVGSFLPPSVVSLHSVYTNERRRTLQRKMTDALLHGAPPLVVVVHAEKRLSGWSKLKALRGAAATVAD